MIDPPINHSQADEEQWRNEQKRYWERQVNISKWLNWITLGGIIVAGIALFFVWQQADSARLAAEAAKDQAISAKTATDIAKQGFDESVKTFRSEQRAWILPKDTRIKATPDFLHLEFQISNSGKVPAMIVGATYRFSDTRLPQCPPLIIELPAYGMALPPNGENWIGMTIKGKTRVEVEQSERVYVYGQINYTDTFPGTKHSLFCSIFHPKSGHHEICPFCNAYD